MVFLFQQSLVPYKDNKQGNNKQQWDKDANANGEWVALGEGICDFPSVMELLDSVVYDGWLVAEEESDDAAKDGVAAIRKNRAYLRSIGC